MPSFIDPPSSAERTDWMRSLVDEDRTFPEEVTTFDRSGLADAMEVFAARWDWESGDPDQRAFAEGILAEAITLGLVDPASPGTLARWIGDASILSSLREHLLASRPAQRSTVWLEWTERRFTLAAAQAVLDALASSNRNVDADDLLIDLDPVDRAMFSISEQSPGGTGQVEALVVDMIENPDRLDLALADVLQCTDLELLDDQLRNVTESNDATVRQAVADLSASWGVGHDAVRMATEALDAALEVAGIDLGATATTALTTRFAGPGSERDFLSEIRQWIAVRDMAQDRSGYAIEPRTLAALLSDRMEVDSFLHLADPSQPERARAIANVLWPWGRSARGARSHNPYAGALDGAVALLRRYWKSPVEFVELDQWTDEVRKDLHERLRNLSELVLVAPISRRTTLRTALLDLQTNPVEVGPLWCYPVIIGIRERSDSVEARVRLEETW